MNNVILTDKDGNIWESKDIYPCDKCEESIFPNDESIEVRYGFICALCAGH